MGSPAGLRILRCITTSSVCIMSIPNGSPAGLRIFRYVTIRVSRVKLNISPLTLNCLNLKVISLISGSYSIVRRSLISGSYSIVRRKKDVYKICPRRSYRVKVLDGGVQGDFLLLAGVGYNGLGLQMFHLFQLDLTMFTPWPPESIRGIIMNPPESIRGIIMSPPESIRGIIMNPYTSLWQFF